MTGLPPVPMRRSLEYAKVTTDDEGNPVVTLLCDCATVTDLTVEVEGGPFEGPGAHGAEIAYTCEGCGTTHWFMLVVKR